MSFWLYVLTCFGVAHFDAARSIWVAPTIHDHLHAILQATRNFNGTSSPEFNVGKKKHQRTGCRKKKWASFFEKKLPEWSFWKKKSKLWYTYDFKNWWKVGDLLKSCYLQWAVAKVPVFNCEFPWSSSLDSAFVWSDSMNFPSLVSSDQSLEWDLGANIEKWWFPTWEDLWTCRIKHYKKKNPLKNTDM